MIRGKDPKSRTIKTARSEEEINKAARDGFRPLVKPVQPSPDIWSKVMVYQHKETGEIKTWGDFRGGFFSEEYEPVTDFIKYYPHEVGNPFAAYLIPPDLKPGDYVYLEDLIEDIRNEIWNQGDSERLASCHATWTGEEFELDQSEVDDARFSTVVG
jgi:hypothetical protein